MIVLPFFGVNPTPFIRLIRRKLTVTYSKLGQLPARSIGWNYPNKME